MLDRSKIHALAQCVFRHGVWGGDGVRQVTQQADEPTVPKQNVNNKKRLQGIQQEQFGGENTLEKKKLRSAALKKEDYKQTINH